MEAKTNPPIGRRHHRRNHLKTLATLLGSATAGGTCTSRPSRPNIIFILADDLGYGDLGCYGQQIIRTPHLDRMARDGIRFTQHYSGSTVCAPARCSLMTGLHTGHAVIRGNREVQPMGQYPLPQEQVTVAELLKAAGYRTALIGKWGLGGPGSEGEPTRQGFDYFFGYLCQRHAHNYYPEFLFRNTERVAVEGNVVPDPRPDGSGKAAQRAQYSPDLMLDEALAFIADNRDHPFFLYFPSTLPHANNEAGTEGMEVPSFGEYADTGWPDPQKGHAAMISYLDRTVGAIREAVEQAGLSSRTLLVFTSDNGPHREGGADPDFFSSSGGLRGIKRDLYEGGIRVPLIACWPGRIAAGADSHHVSAFWDFLSTFAELAGVAAPAGCDGVSLLGALTGASQNDHEYLYWEFQGQQAARRERWKAVKRTAESPLELYDLAEDPQESRDLAADRPEVVARMAAILREAHTPSELFPLRG